MQGSRMRHLAPCPLFLPLLLLCGLDALTKTGKFPYSGFRGRSKYPPLVSKTGTGKAECATACEQHAACKSFSFRSGSEGCSLFPRRIMALDVDLSVASEEAHYFRVWASCPAGKGYVPLPGTTKCIRVESVPKAWGQAAENCAEEGGNLLIIENDDVMQKLQDFLPQGSYIVGFTDENMEGQYLWLDRTSVNMTMFGGNEPSDETSSFDEDCGILEAKTPQQGLHDLGCSEEVKFICSLPMEE